MVLAVTPAVTGVSPWVPRITHSLLSSAEFLSKRNVVSSGCPATTVESCSTDASGTCCFEAPGGLIVQPQFWDTDPETGPANSWTIHGLWPDNCDGTFSENCDPSRDYTDIGTLITDAGLPSLVTYMDEFWVNDDGTSEELWEHEWATHGTCYSTLQVDCLPSGSSKGLEAVAFFQTAVGLFQTLPTYDWLEAAGITPSTSKTWTLKELQTAIKDSWGYTPAFDCDDGAVSEIYYYFYLEGSMIDGTFVPIDVPASEAGSCSSSGSIKYTPKSGASTTTPTSSQTKTSTKTTKTTTTTSKTTKTTTTSTKTKTSTSTTATATGVAKSIPTKATISALTSDGSSVGGLLSYGTWSTQTPGTYELDGSPSAFTMTSSKGSCGVSGGVFACGAGTSSTFSALASGSDTVLAYEGSSAFSADDSPSGSVQETVYTGGSHSETFSLVFDST